MPKKDGSPKRKEAKELAIAAFKECLDIVEEHALEVAKGGPERHTDLPLSLEALFGRGSGGSSLN